MYVLAGATTSDAIFSSVPLETNRPEVNPIVRLWASPQCIGLKMWPESLPSLIIIAGCITVTGLGLKYLDRWQNGGKVLSQE